MSGIFVLNSAMPTLIPWAFTSTLLILAVLTVRWLTRNRLSSVNRYALWAVVLIRLLIPIQLPFLSSLGAVDFAPQMEDTPVYAFPTDHIDAPESYIQHIWEEQGEDPVMSAGITSRGFPALGGLGFDYYSGGTVLEENGYTDYAFFSTVPRILSILWGTGAAVMLLFLIGSNLRFAARLRRSRRPLDIPECPLPVYVIEDLSSPCLFGLFRPVVYLTPQAAADSAAREHVLAHELTHYAHRDHLWAPLRCLALALHWYNPLVWLAVLLSKRDGELACDEGAVRRLGEDQRIPYGRTLVGMVAQRSLRPADLLSCSTAMTGGKKTIQQRIALLVKHPETRAAAVFGACVALALVAVFTFSDGNQSGGPAGDYRRFLSDVQSAQSIRLGQPTTSSQFDPTAITDPELLAEAKEILKQECPDWLNPPQVVGDLDPASLRTLTLTDQQGAEVRYLLAAPADRGNSGDFYVLTDGELSGTEVSGRRVAALMHQQAAVQLYDLMNRQGAQSGAIPLTAEELAYFNDGSFFDNGTGSGGNAYINFSIRNQFLTSWYDHPADIDLYQLFYLGTGNPSSISEEERRLVIDRGYGGADPDCGCTKITRQEMDAVLLEHTGLTLEETNLVGLGDFTYLPEYDAYYHFHGDTNYTVPSFESGSRHDSILYLNYGDHGACQLVLRAVDGGYQFIANRSTQVGNVPSSYTRLEKPEHIAALVELLVQDQAFLTENAQYLGITPEALADALQGKGEEGVSPDLLVIGTYNGWVPDQWGRGYGYRLTVWGGGSVMFMDLTFPAALNEQVLAFHQQDSLELIQKDLTQRLSALTPQDIQSVSGGRYDLPVSSDQLAGMLNRMAGRYLGPDGSDSFSSHRLWTLDILLPEDVTLYLSAGLVEDQVDIDGLLFESPELYQLIRQRWTPPAGSIVREDLSPVAEAVDRLLADELAKWNQDFTDSGLSAPYTGVELTQFRLLSSYPDLLKEGTVKLYAFDYGLTTGNLEEAGWAGGNYADGDGLFHPYGHVPHLLTVEGIGHMERSQIILWEFPLVVGSQGYEELVTQDYVRDVVVSNLRDLLDPVVPASVTDPQKAAEAYGRALAQYYSSFGSSHPSAVTYAALYEARVYQQAASGLCAAITLAVDPVEANNIYWQSGAGLDPGPDGHWLYTLEYCLERQEDGTWRCTDSGTGGVRLERGDPQVIKPEPER